MEPRPYAACRVKRGPAAVRRVEHASDGDEVLCGLPGRSVEIYRHLWYPGHAAACPDCVAAYTGPADPF